MKRSALTCLAALGCAAFLTGCLFPRYTTLEEKYPVEKAGESGETMTAEQASAYLKDRLANVPAGRRPDYPGDRVLGKFTTSIRLRRHNRTDLVLVEIKRGKHVELEFYVNDQAEGEKVAAAVWRLHREYNRR